MTNQIHSGPQDPNQTTLSFNAKLLRPGQHVTVRKSGEHSEYKSVIDGINDSFLEIAIPSAQGIFMFPRPTDSYVITAPCEAGIFAFECRYLSHVMSPVGLIRVSIPRTMTKLQNRNHVRINDYIPFTLQPDGNGEQFDGATKNISAGGMLISLRCNLNIGDRFTIRFKLSGPDEPVQMTLRGLVVRTAEVDIETQKNYYGIQFLDVTEKVRYQLIRYIFRRQAQIIKMTKETP